MRKLLSANVSRLWKDKVFWLGFLFMFGLGIFVIYTKYSDIIRYHSQGWLDDVMFAYAMMNGGCCAIFCSLFLGTEYSDGTIRNKLIVGHTRTAIYCSNWLVSIFAAVLMIMAYLLSYCTLGSFVLEAPQASIKTLLFYIFVSLFTASAYASLFNMLAMLITTKSSSAVICLLVFLGLLIAAMTINYRLVAPEFTPYYSMTSDGAVQSVLEPNPQYLQPAARKIYQFFFDFLPSGQSLQLSGLEVAHPFLAMLYSSIISVGSTILGVLAFRKRNLK